MADRTITFPDFSAENPAQTNVQVKVVELEDGTFALATAPAPGVIGVDSTGGYFPITPNNSADLASPAQWIYCPTSGDLRISGPNGTPATFTIPAPGIVELAPIPAHRVYATGTTISGLIGGKLS